MDSNNDKNEKKEETEETPEAEVVETAAAAAADAQDEDAADADDAAAKPEAEVETTEAPVVKQDNEEGDDNGDDNKDVKQDEATTTATTTATAATATKEEEVDSRLAIWEPSEFDVLSGRGASVNAHGGNKKFRALCFSRKPLFDAGNHAAKRRIATEIVGTIYNDGQARFLRKKVEKGPWFEMTREQAILKACQVMRDYKRPDRLAIREMMAQNGQARKRSRQTESTPMLDIPVPPVPVEPIIENPFGVKDHDILCGRGAFVNGHVGNQRLRLLAQERKAAFDAGNYTEKRSLAGEIVQIIKALDPPGRFLKRATGGGAGSAAADKKDDDASASASASGGGGWDEASKSGTGARTTTTDETGGEWEELSHEKAIHKACQVMRDIDRPDRKDREERRAKKKQKILEAKGGLVATTTSTTGAVAAANGDDKDAVKDTTAATTAEKTAVEEAVAATEEALDKAMDAAAAVAATATASTVKEEEEDAAGKDGSAAAAAAPESIEV